MIEVLVFFYLLAATFGLAAIRDLYGPGDDPRGGRPCYAIVTPDD